MTRQEMKAKAKEQLGGNLFGDKWLLAAGVLIVSGLILSAATAVTFGIGSIILAGPLMYGCYKLFLKQARDHQLMNFAGMFDGFTEDFGQNLLLALMNFIFVMLWSMLFVIPGIVKYYAYSMAYYIKVDHPEMKWNECLKARQEMMKGHKMDRFVLDLSFIGWMFVGALCFGIGLLWVIPYYRATEAQFYESVKAA